jgi:TRAP-type mannitol/chloroaromatic compound transport system permease small subunit
MPDLQFVLPHWLYWAGLILFPLIAMMLVRRQKRIEEASGGRSAETSVMVGYFLLITAGFVGVHRFYAKNWRGVIYLPLFAGIIFANIEVRDAREKISLANSDYLVAEFDVEDAQYAVDDDAEDTDAVETLGTAKGALEDAAARLTNEKGGFAMWSSTAFYFAAAIAALLLIDAALMPRLVRSANQRAAAAPPTEERPAEEPLPPPPPSQFAVVRGLEMASRYSGEFVAYWAVLAVFAYYYEVVARYIFNSPTNWVHEAMFLMFGMMFLVSGAYAYLNDSHVRVDIFYAKMSPRRKAVTDLLTSIFFFIFAGTLLVTGWIFMMDSVEVGEVSFTEWAIQYWPVKISIVVGAALLLVQGVAKMLVDLATIVSPGR